MTLQSMTRAEKRRWRRAFEEAIAGDNTPDRSANYANGVILEYRLAKVKP